MPPSLSDPTTPQQRPARPRPRPDARASLRVERHRTGSPGFAALLPWLDGVLRAGRGGRLASEYPRVVSRDSGAIACVVRAGARVRAHALLWPVRLRWSGTRRPIGMVSWVVTDPGWRRRGLGGRVMQAVHELAAELELDWTLLWTDRERFFHGQGYRPRGQERMLRLEPAVLAALRQIPALRRREGDAPIRVESGASAAAVAYVERCREERRCGIEGAGDAPGGWRSIPELALRVAWRGDRPVAFAMSGRGDDLRGVVHEWAGEAMGLLACLDSLQPAPGAGPLRLLAPAAGEPFIDRLERLGAPVERQPLGWFRPIRREIPRTDAEDLFVWGLDSI